jgi:hypothetical protein
MKVYHLLDQKENKIILKEINIFIDAAVVETRCNQIFRLNPRLMLLKSQTKEVLDGTRKAVVID